MTKLIKYLTKRDWLLMLVCLLFITLQVFLELKIPDYMSEITKYIQMGNDGTGEILQSGLKMLACAFCSLLSSALVAVAVSRLSANFTAILREKLFDKVQNFSLQEINSFSTPSLITRSTNDITQIQVFVVMGFQVIIRAPITAVWATLKIYGKAWQWTFSTATAVVILLLCIGVCMALAIPKFRRLQVLTDNINRVTRENLTGLSVVRAYNAEEYQERKFARANDELTGTHLYTSRVLAFMMPSIQLIMSALPLAIYWIGAKLINEASMLDKITLFSDMVVYSSYAMQIVMAFMMLVVVFIMYPRASVAAKRVREVLDTEETIIDGEGDFSGNDTVGKVEFRDVSFKYPGADDYVVKDISFCADKGQTLAFIGATGCGKSTILNLLMRFYDANDGEVLVDNQNVKAVTQHALREKIAYVSQKAVLFSGDIKSNVALGEDEFSDSTREKVDSAIEVAQASEFVNKLDDKSDSFVAQGGTNFSGGQKQRLSIARAIYRNAEIMIFDDSFSALDYKTDKILRNALKEKCKDATKLIVAQRIGTIRDADKIIVLDKGRIAGMGTHKELMHSCGVYKEIAYSQLSKEELQ